MTKELSEDLTIIREYSHGLSQVGYLEVNHACDDIEKELQRLEAIDNANPSEALEQIKTLKGFNQVELNNDKNVNKSLNTIKQALIKAEEMKKVLEIIFEKDVDMYSLRRCKTSEEYNEHFAIDEYQKLTEEEFNLLKRYLCQNE